MHTKLGILREDEKARNYHHTLCLETLSPNTSQYTKQHDDILLSTKISLTQKQTCQEEIPTTAIKLIIFLS